MILASKLSARWARIYQQPIDEYACKQADFVNMAHSINIQSVEDYITRRWLLKMSRAYLQVLEKRLMDAIRILYMNPSKCFSRKCANIEIEGPFKSAVITVPIPIPTKPPKRIRLRATLIPRKVIS